jgi:hypothetical protein
VFLGRRRTFGVGASVYTASRPSTLAVDASIPHPFFFNRARQATGSIDGLEHRELALAVQGRFEQPLNRKFRLAVFGGPAFVRVERDLFASLEYTETYPYDAITVERVATTSASGSGIGFNGGVDVTYALTPKVGIGGGGQYMGATVTLQDSADRDVDVKAGGFLITAGVRLRF